MDGAEEDLDGRVGAARGAAAEDGERRGAVGQQPAHQGGGVRSRVPGGVRGGGAGLAVPVLRPVLRV
ncbi:hypothetical protein DMB38_06855 [Streptomyces sp. WAC 06738]|nr:hypothetical protein DMB38_06855 [Streptomyces sp. WAC 06738]